MALILSDRVKSNTTTTGTGTVVLAATAPTGYQSFAVIGDNNTTYYTIAGQTTSEWEVGIGTYYSGNVSLSRDTILASSNANAVVTFSAGTKDVFVTYPAERAIYSNATGIPVFIDSTFTLQDVVDSSKQARFQLSGLNANNTVVYTLPAGSANASTLIDSATSQAITGVKTFSSTTQNIGSSAGNTTVNIAYGATLATSNKTINLGTGGVAGALVNVTIGQANTIVNTTAWGNLTVSQFLTANNFVGAANIAANVAYGAFSYGTLGYSDTGIFASYANTANTYVQVIAQNLSNGTNASVDFVLVNDTGTAYADFGITSSKYTGSGALSAANVAYIYAGAADLVIGTATANAVHFVVNNSATDAFTINASGAWGANGSYGTANQVYTSQGSGLPPVWANVASGGAQAAGNSSIIINNVNITANATIAAGQNGFSVGPITTANGVTVTVSAGQTWVVI